MITWFIEVTGFLILQLLWMGKLFYNVNVNYIFMSNRITVNLLKILLIIFFFEILIEISE